MMMPIPMAVRPWMLAMKACMITPLIKDFGTGFIKIKTVIL
jgi:hypothetical protein